MSFGSTAFDRCSDPAVVEVFGQPGVNVLAPEPVAGVASFSALYYAVASAVDSTYRDEFIERLTQQLQETFRERGEYLELIAARDRALASRVG